MKQALLIHKTYGRSMPPASVFLTHRCLPAYHPITDSPDQVRMGEEGKFFNPIQEEMGLFHSAVFRRVRGENTTRRQHHPY